MRVTSSQLAIDMTSASAPVAAPARVTAPVSLLSGVNNVMPRASLVERAVESPVPFVQPTLPVNTPILPSTSQVSQTNSAGVRGVAMVSPLDDVNPGTDQQNLQVRSIFMPHSNPRLVNPYVSSILCSHCSVMNLLSS